MVIRNFTSKGDVCVANYKVLSLANVDRTLPPTQGVRAYSRTPLLYLLSHPDPPHGRGEKEGKGAFCYLEFGRRNFSRIHPLTQSPRANTQYF